MGSVTSGGSSHTVPGQELSVGWERAVYHESMDMYCLGAGITQYLFNTIRSTWPTVPIPSGYGDSAIIGIVLDNHIELELVRNSVFSAGIIFIHYSLVSVP